MFDNARVTDQHVPYPGSDDERTQRDLWPTDTREVAYDASVDRWLRSKTRRAHAKTIAAPPPPRPARAQQLSLTSEDFSAIATFALDQRLISADQGLGVARTLARACRTSPFYDAATAYVPVHVTYLLTRPSRTRLRTIALLIDAMLIGAGDDLTSRQSVGEHAFAIPTLARDVLDAVLAATA